MIQVGLPAWKLPLVAQHFTSLVAQNAHEIPLFPHVDRMLRHLSSAQLSLAIVSSNAYANIVRILGAENSALIAHFECGMSILGKTARIKRVLKKAAVPAVEALYIGDQASDLDAAREAGVAFGAVTWGYGTIESLRERSPEEEFSSVLDLERIA